MIVSRHAVVAARGSRGLVVTGAACCRRKQDGREGSRRRSSAPDAPQWRPCGTADSAGAGREGGGGTNPSSSAPGGTASVVARNHTSAHKEDL